MINNYGLKTREVFNAGSTEKETKETLYSIIDAGLHTLQTKRANLQIEYNQLIQASRDPDQNTAEFFAKNQARIE